MKVIAYIGAGVIVFWLVGMFGVAVYRFGKKYGDDE